MGRSGHHRRADLTLPAYTNAPQKRQKRVDNAIGMPYAHGMTHVGTYTVDKDARRGEFVIRDKIGNEVHATEKPGTAVNWCIRKVAESVR